MTRPLLNRRLDGLGNSIFGEMSARAAATGSINLGQGFPDVDGPRSVADAAAEAILAGRGNQYPPPTGIPELRRAVARHQQRFYGLGYDPDTEVLITAGATEAIAAALLALLEPGDEVIAFEPYYDSYVAGIAMAGAARVPLTLSPPGFRPDLDKLVSMINGRTRLLLLNSPHNPTGMVLTRAETEALARIAIDHDLLVITDEAYEHLTFDRAHIPLASIPGMRERTVSIGSAGKTFSFTGWKVGWATGTPELVAAVRTTKQFLTYVSSGPFQYAVAEALDLPDRYFTAMAEDLKGRRDLLASGLRDIGFEVYQPDGTYFITTDIAPLGERDAMEFCLALPDRAGVVAIPSAVFYDDNPEAGRTMVRFAFCKRPEVLNQAISRLSVLAGTGSLGPWRPAGRLARMGCMTTSGNLLARFLRGLQANWPALLLPLIAGGALGLTASKWPELVIILVLILTALAPRESARIAPYALFAYGAYGLYLMHSLLIREANSVTYGFVHASWRPVNVGVNWYVADSGDNRWVLAEAVACLVAGMCLLARPGSLGGGPVRRAVEQLRGTGGQPKTVPPLLLIGVVFLWEELFGQDLWFGTPWQPGFTPMMLVALLIVAAAVAAVVWLPRAAALLAVAGTVLFGLIGVLSGVQWIADPRSAPVGPWSGYTVGFYGPVPLDGGITGLFAGLEGIALVALGCLLAPRLLTWSADFELAERAQALARRVDGLTRTRTDATDTAVAELRRIERDLHDGAQARLVALGMSLRAVEQLMGTNPEAALALVAEARETSSRALEDLRDLVRGIYPPVLADRGLAEAVRNLAMDAVVDVDVDVALPGEPPMPVAAAVYFALAEALTNAVRHAGAGTVRVGLEHADGILRATVTDDGRGGADASRGTGLAGVERRLATFDGILAVSSPAGGPTKVVIEVPCALSSVKISSC